MASLPSTAALYASASISSNNNNITNTNTITAASRAMSQNILNGSLEGVPGDITSTTATTTAVASTQSATGVVAVAAATTRAVPIGDILTTPMERSNIGMEKVSVGERVRRILLGFTPEQRARYEAYRCTRLNRSTIKSIMMGVTGVTNVSVPVLIVMGGISKVLIGEIVEAAINVRNERGDEGALQPVHVREATRRLKRLGVLPQESRGGARKYRRFLVT